MDDENSSSKVRYIKLQSSTDRASGTLAAPTFDLTASSFLQNCRAVQLLSCGFSNLTPNVRQGENVVVLQTNDVNFHVPTGLPDMNVRIAVGIGSVYITIPSPPGGVYTSAEEWANHLTLSLSHGIADAGSFDFGITVTVASKNPTRFSWQLISVHPPSAEIVYFDPTDAIAPYLGITPGNSILHGLGSLQLQTWPEEHLVGTLHSIAVPTDNYTIEGLISALNAAIPPNPSLVAPTWIFSDDRVQVATALDYPSVRVVSVIENRQSSLAPILGFHGDTVPDRFFNPLQVADSAPGMHGLVNAYLHIRSLATGGCVTVSSVDRESLEVSVFGQIATHNIPYGEFHQHDVSKSGDSFITKYHDDRDISRLQCRIRDHQGKLLTLGHPGLTLFFRVWLR
jgi:hypothetical protein